MFHRAKNGGLDKDYRFTLPSTLEACRERFGTPPYTLDVAACPQAHVSPRYYALENNQDALTRPWGLGDSDHVWCNPPWSKIKPWIVKAWDEFSLDRFRSLTMLIPVRTEQPYWQEHVEPFRDSEGPLTTWFLPKRQKFGSPSDPLGLNAGSPPFICVALNWTRP